MPRTIFLVLIASFLYCTQVVAQKVNTDSLKLISKISDDQLKLGKLQNMVDQKINKKKDDSVAAQQAADKNATAATRLTTDPQNKEDAKNADKAASTAKSDSKKARKAAEDLDKLRKNIADLQSKIVTEQAELSRFTGATNMPSAQTPIIQTDTTQGH